MIINMLYYTLEYLPIFTGSKIRKKNINVGTGLVGAPACGDVMQLQIKVNNDGIIEKAVFKTFGCGSAIASASFTTELLHGMHIDKATMKATLKLTMKATLKATLKVTLKV